ncbi:MAG: ATP-binding protein, partial [Gammaproteobacteria bacterium]|nr:ATP-binding protein [Gammaproteobacteria bacterium]
DQLHINPRPIPLRQVIDSVTELLGAITAEKPIEFYTFIDPDVPDVIVADDVRLRQVLFNMGSNAVKFTNEGQVSITIKCNADRENNNAKLTIIVKDTGIGIPEDRLGDLFKPFTQIDSTTTRKQGGTGLGLSIVKHLVDVMGGEIHVSSKLSEGTEFRVALPVAVENQPAADKQSNLDRVRILGLVAKTAQREVIKSHLSRIGCKIEFVDSIDELINTFEANRQNPFNAVYFGYENSDTLVTETVHKLKNRGGIEKLPYIAERGRKRHEILNQPYAVDVAMPLTYSGLLNAVMEISRLAPNIPQQDDADAKITALKNSQRILIVEDEKVNQAVLSAQLRALGYEHDVAVDGRDALRKLAESEFDAIVTDCYMPEMDGFELTKCIRQNEQSTGEHIPIVALTADARQEHGSNCISAGMDVFLTKPVRLDRLREVLKNCLKKKPYNPRELEEAKNKKGGA